MLNRGLFLNRGQMTISTPMDESVIRWAVEVVSDVVDEVSSLTLPADRVSS